MRRIYLTVRWCYRMTMLLFVASQAIIAIAFRLLGDDSRYFYVMGVFLFSAWISTTKRVFSEPKKLRLGRFLQALTWMFLQILFCCWIIVLVLR